MLADLRSLAIALLLLSAAGAFLAEVDGNPFVLIPKDNWARAGVEAIDTKMVGAMPLEVALHAEGSSPDFTHPESLAKIDALQSAVLTQYGGDFTSGLAVTEYLKEMHKSFADNGAGHLLVASNSSRSERL